MLRLHYKYILASICLVFLAFLHKDHRVQTVTDINKHWKCANIIACGHRLQHTTTLIFLQGINCILVSALLSFLFNIQTKTVPVRKGNVHTMLEEFLLLVCFPWEHKILCSLVLWLCCVWHITKNLSHHFKWCKNHSLST